MNLTAEIHQLATIFLARYLFRSGAANKLTFGAHAMYPGRVDRLYGKEELGDFGLTSLKLLALVGTAPGLEDLASEGRNLRREGQKPREALCHRDDRGGVTGGPNVSALEECSREFCATLRAQGLRA